MASTALVKVGKTLPELRSTVRKLSDKTIQKHVGILQQLAAANNGMVPPCRWFKYEGKKYFRSYDVSTQYPGAFAHLKREADKKFEIYQAHNSGTPEILPPQKRNILAPESYKTIAEYDVPGARFSPTELRISEGLDEQHWMQIGRALAHVCMSTFWWIGDFILYGKQHYGQRVAYDLAQQSTAFSKAALNRCVRVARRYPPERRVEALTFYHHSILASFLPELSDKLLAEAVEYGYTARQLKKMADEAVGIPEFEKSWKQLTFVIAVNDYDELHARSLHDRNCPMDVYGKNRVKWMIGNIVSEWLARKREEENGTTVAAA
jgi:hypothetical protein